MRLRTKLSVVLALLVSTLVANVALSVWSIRFLEQELALPLRSMESVMHRLYEIKRAGESEIDLISQAIDTNDPDPSSVQLISARLTMSEGHINQMIGELESLPSVMLRSGITTIHNMKSRSLLIMNANEQWANSTEQSDGRLLIDLIDARHELIERIEGRILDDAQLAADFGQNLKARMYSIILVTLVGALAIGLLMVMFIRRWVFSPIEQLRAGAKRMSLGNFDLPIDVHTNDELGQLSDEFNRMGILIGEMQDRKIEQERLAAMGEMAQRTVHNLRTPLAGIRALSETTLDELEPQSDLRDLQTRIISTVDRFEGWLKEMLRTSAPLELHLGEYCPKALVDSVIDAHRSAAESNGLTINYATDNPPKAAIGDAHHLEHAITAIMSNAVEFAPPSSTISIKLDQMADNQGQYWTLRIANAGPMIPQDLHRTIFRPYFTTRQSGTGIGLAMCQRVIDQHHGLIDIESPLNDAQRSGCAFRLSIPTDSSSNARQDAGQ